MVIASDLENGSCTLTATQLKEIKFAIEDDIIAAAGRDAELKSLKDWLFERVEQIIPEDDFEVESSGLLERFKNSPKILHAEAPLALRVRCYQLLPAHKKTELLQENLKNAACDFISTFPESADDVCYQGNAEALDKLKKDFQHWADQWNTGDEQADEEILLTVESFVNNLPQLMQKLALVAMITGSQAVQDGGRGNPACSTSASTLTESLPPIYLRDTCRGTGTGGGASHGRADAQAIRRANGIRRDGHAE